VSVEQVQAASDHIARAVDELIRNGVDPGLLHLALVDASVHLGRIYSSPNTSTATLLRRLSKLAISMAKDEEEEARREQH